MTVLEKYQLNEFMSLVVSIRNGDLRTFNDSLINYQHRFIRQGTYLLLEKCKTLCYRNLFKRIHHVITTTESIPSNLHQISLQQVRTVFHWLNMMIDLDEIECILANLIYRGYVRGYLSHSKRVLVLSKRDPFPLSSVVPK
jgi:nuclear mRNA export protein PCID2/THP1